MYFLDDAWVAREKQQAVEGGAKFVSTNDVFASPQKALCGGIPDPYLEPLTRCWSHFLGIYRQILTTSLTN